MCNEDAHWVTEIQPLSPKRAPVLPAGTYVKQMQKFLDGSSLLAACRGFTCGAGVGCPCTFSVCSAQPSSQEGPGLALQVSGCCFCSCVSLTGTSSVVPGWAVLVQVRNGAGALEAVIVRGSPFHLLFFPFFFSIIVSPSPQNAQEKNSFSGKVFSTRNSVVEWEGEMPKRASKLMSVSS